MSVLVFPEDTATIDPVEVHGTIKAMEQVAGEGLSVRAFGTFKLGQVVNLYDIFGRPLYTGSVYEINGNEHTFELEGLGVRLINTKTPAIFIPNTMYVDEALEAIFAAWQEAYQWFNYAPVPRMYIRKPDGGLLRPRLLALVIDAERTMADVLNEFLNFTPGYVAVFIAGRLHIRPPRNTPIEVISGQAVWVYSTTLSVEPVPVEIPITVARYRLPPPFGDGAMVEKETATIYLMPGGWGAYDIPVAGAMVYAQMDDEGHITFSAGAFGYVVSVYGMVYPAPIEIAARSVVNFGLAERATDYPTKAVVKNSERYEFVGTSTIAAPSFLRVWGVRPNVGFPEVNFPTLNDLPTSGRQNLAHFRTKLISGTSILPPQSFFVPASQANLVLGDYVDITVRFMWFADQNLDFANYGPAGDYTVVMRVQVGRTGMAYSEPDLPGPLIDSRAYARLYLSPVVEGRVFQGIAGTIEGKFAELRLGPGFGGDGAWGLGLGVLIDALGPTLQKSNTVVIGVYEGTDAKSEEIKAAFGTVEKTLEIRGITIDATTASSIARGIVERKIYTDAAYTLELAPPFLPASELGRIVLVPGLVKGRVEAIDYHEVHEPAGLSVRQMLTVRDAVLLEPPKETPRLYWFGSWGDAW